MNAAKLAMTEPVGSFSRWMCPHEMTSCSAIAASASQVLHRLLVRTQRIGKTGQPPIRTVYNGGHPGQCLQFENITLSVNLAGLLPGCNSRRLTRIAFLYRWIFWRRQRAFSGRHNTCYVARPRLPSLKATETTATRRIPRILNSTSISRPRMRATSNARTSCECTGRNHRIRIS